jgi:hypothetical protein
VGPFCVPFVGRFGRLASDRTAAARSGQLALHPPSMTRDVPVIDAAFLVRPARGGHPLGDHLEQLACAARARGSAVRGGGVRGA